MPSAPSALAPTRAKRRPEDGRPSKLERIPPKVREEILERIAIGVPRKHAAESCGIHYSTFKRWLERGSGEEAREPYRTFAEQVDVAHARFVVAKVQDVYDAGSEDWRAAMELLKRRGGEEFRDPDRAQAGTTVNVQVTLEVERRELASRMLDAAAQVFGEQPEALERFAALLAGGEVVEGEARELPEAAG